METAWSVNEPDAQLIKKALTQTLMAKQISVKVKTSHTRRRSLKAEPIKTDTLYNLLVLTVPFGGMVVSSWSLRRVKKNEKRLDILGINPHY